MQECSYEFGTDLLEGVDVVLNEGRFGWALVLPYFSFPHPETPLSHQVPKLIGVREGNGVSNIYQSLAYLNSYYLYFSCNFMALTRTASVAYIVHRNVFVH